MRSDVPLHFKRRRLLAACALAPLATAGSKVAAKPKQNPSMTLYTFGDSVLDCGHYNDRGITPGQLLVHNDDTLFPEFKGRDLSARGPATLVHRAVDGATVDGLASQIKGATPEPDATVIVSIGGNDLLGGLAADQGPGLSAFERQLDDFLGHLHGRRMLLATVYDPTLGDDSKNFLGVDAKVARGNQRRMNELLTRLGKKHGKVAVLHAHFMQGDPSWFVHTIEPSLKGASEIRRVFLAAMG